MKQFHSINRLLFSFILVCSCQNVYSQYREIHVARLVRFGDHPPYAWSAVQNEGNLIYTKFGIDGLFSSYNAAYADSLSIVRTSINRMEDHFNSLIKDSINKLPQRLLTEEAKNIIKEAVLAELRNELATLRQDLQKQIDEIKARR